LDRAKKETKDSPEKKKVFERVQIMERKQEEKRKKAKNGGMEDESLG